MYHPPEPNEIEISLFGPGYGESIVIHIGNNNWIIIDSCIHSSITEPIPIHYLNKLNIDLARQVKLIVATHWHDDHIKGISEIVQKCNQALFCCSDALRSNEFLTITTAYYQSGFMEESGVSEFGKVLVHLKERKKNNKPLFGSENKIIYHRSASDSGIGEPISIISLSPSSAAKIKAMSSISSLIPDLSGRAVTKRRIPDPKTNSTSLALWLSIGELHFLLGGDLEESASNEIGWKRVIENESKPDGKAKYFKIPHHGSHTAHNEEVWKDLLHENIISCLTPFKLGRTCLPTKEDIDRIYSVTTKAFSTSKLNPPSSIKRDSAVMKTIKNTVKYIHPVLTSKGQIRIRIKPTEENEMNIELLNGAVELKEVYSIR